MEIIKIIDEKDVKIGDYLVYSSGSNIEHKSKLVDIKDGWYRCSDGTEFDQTKRSSGKLYKIIRFESQTTIEVGDILEHDSYKAIIVKFCETAVIIQDITDYEVYSLDNNNIKFWNIIGKSRKIKFNLLDIEFKDVKNNDLIIYKDIEGKEYTQVAVMFNKDCLFIQHFNDIEQFKEIISEGRKFKIVGIKRIQMVKETNIEIGDKLIIGGNSFERTVTCIDLHKNIVTSFSEFSGLEDKHDLITGRSIDGYFKIDSIKKNDFIIHYHLTENSYFKIVVNKKIKEGKFLKHAADDYLIILVEVDGETYEFHRYDRYAYCNGVINKQIRIIGYYEKLDFVGVE